MCTCMYTRMAISNMQPFTLEWLASWTVSSCRSEFMSQITWDHHHHLGLGAHTFSLLLGTRSFQSWGSWGGDGGDEDPSTVTNFGRLCCWENTLNITNPFLVCPNPTCREVFNTPFLQHHKPHQRTTHLGLIREVILQRGKQKKKTGVRVLIQ